MAANFWQGIPINRTAVMRAKATSSLMLYYLMPFLRSAGVRLIAPTRLLKNLHQGVHFYNPKPIVLPSTSKRRANGMAIIDQPLRHATIRGLSRVVTFDYFG